MADRLTNIEFLLMLSDDVKAQGDDPSAEMHRQGTAHARRVMELIAMLEKARVLLDRERQRFSAYLPREVDPQRQLQEDKAQLPPALQRQVRPKVAAAE